jgi:hypothetical protein
MSTIQKARFNDSGSWFADWQTETAQTGDVAAAPSLALAIAAVNAASSGVSSSPAGVASSVVSATGTGSAPAWIATLSDSLLKADMTAASAGGTVSEASVAKLFTDLGNALASGNTTLSASQFADLKTIAANLNNGETAPAYLTYVVNALVNGNAANAYWTGGTSKTTALGNLAAGATSAQVSQLTGKWLLGTDLPISSVSMSGTPAFNVTYSTVSSPLFAASGPGMSDINQGYLGDCYLLSSLAEVAQQNPSLIKSMITDNGNGTYGVRFYVNGAARYVTVNNQLANGGSIFNRGTNDWASLVEKAYAQLQASGVVTGNSVNYGNSFSTIGNGGAPDHALEEITGASSITDFYASGSSWVRYQYNSSFGYVSSSSNLTTASVLSTLVADLAAGFDAVLSSWTNAKDSSGKTTLVASHAMSIYGYDAATGNLQIRNPWGTAGGQSWATTFEVSLSTLLAAGDTITVDNATSGASVVNGALVSAAAGLQANSAITSFSIADTAANVVAALASLVTDTKLTSIALTDASTPTLSLTAAQYAADTGVLAKIGSAFKLTVTGATAAGAAVLQAAAQVTGFTIGDSSANISAALTTLSADTKLSAIALTDSNPLNLTYAQYLAGSAALAKLSGSYSLAVTGATAASAAALQANSHVTSFTVSDSASAVTSTLSSLNADTKLGSLTITGTSGADTLNLTGSKLSAAIALNGDSAKVTAGLSAPSLTFVGTPDAITLGTGNTAIAFALQSSSGIETIANFQFGHDQLAINLQGASSSVLKLANTLVNGVHAVDIYSSADPTHGVVLLGLSATTTAASITASHLTFSNGQAIIA